MNENNKVFFIINKFSGIGYRPEVEGKIISKCGQLGLECTIEFTKHRGHATELAQVAASQGFQRIFAVGGDGTVNEVARGLVNTTVGMGILPKGSGNGLARHLGIPMRFSTALNLLDSTRQVGMDTFSINNHLSVNVSGIGFDGHVAGLFGKNGKRGLINYGKLVMNEYLPFNEFAVEIDMDENKIKRKTFILAFANSSQFGNNAKVSPHASVCDGLLDVCFISKVPISQALGFARKMFTGNLHHSSFVEILQGKNIKIKFDTLVPYHIDGEAMEPAMNFNITVAPASLKVIVPEHSKSAY